jgi:hypothetical protein
MDYETYQQRVLARASHRWHSEKLDRRDLDDVLEQFIKWGNGLDQIKKALMYGRDFKHPEGTDLDIELPVPAEVPETDQRLIHAMLGVATEGVEMMEAVYNYFKKGIPFDHTNLQEEFGDAEWYRAFGLATLGQSHADNIKQNDAKLELRYGSTFSEDKANRRDLEAERSVLSGTGSGTQVEVRSGSTEPEVQHPETS